ncbi:MAG: 2-amino-4-hydroxy-6-hydroxymethyldihydropteridine diphosphokinase [Zetaproteobacteria bacterium]|nr:MAG: 2-amino-4-hydroxy-6-hydroxymethyldihydropteridine diphosphokinase [Zetaproteobacteria bacterium]
MRPRERVEALIALGGNLGDPAATLAAAARRLAAHPDIDLLGCSALYRSRAVGPGAQPDYRNAVVRVATPLSAEALLALLHRIESAFGRQRRIRWGARTLDLDLLAWGGRCCDRPELRLPHPRMMERPFVLWPLLDVAPGWIHPRSGIPAAEAASRVDEGGCRRVAPPWRWMAQAENAGDGGHILPDRDRTPRKTP